MYVTKPYIIAENPMDTFLVKCTYAKSFQLCLQVTNGMLMTKNGSYLGARETTASYLTSVLFHPSLMAGLVQITPPTTHEDGVQRCSHSGYNREHFINHSQAYRFVYKIR